MSIDVNVQNDLVIVTESSEDITVNVSNAAGPAGVGVPTGGSTGQVLKKQSGTDYDTYWALDGGGVPYSGATGDVNLGEFGLTAGQLTLDVSPTGTAAVGTTRWNNTIGSSETTLKGGSVILKNGVDLVARVVNKVSPNTTLTKAAYQAVKVSGAQGQRLAIALAQANNDANSADTIGLVTETIATNQEGFIMTVGNLEGINTTGSLQGETWADGDVLYLSPTTAGRLTNIKPNGSTGHIVVIGYVEYAHANNGKIYVKIMNGWELDELHNVYIDNPTNNQVLTYESSTSLWKNKTIATALGYTPVPTTRTLTINGTTYDLSADRSWTVSGSATPAGSNTQIQYNNSGAFGASANLVWDNTNARLGIGVGSPNQRVDILGNSNGGQLINIKNSNTSTSAVAGFQAQTDNNEGSLFVTSSGYTPFGVLKQNTLGLYGSNNMNIAVVVNSTGYFSIGTGNFTPTEKLRLTNAGRLLLGTTTEETYLLDVNGTARVSDNLFVEKNQNALTYIGITNTTSGISSASKLVLFSSGGVSNFAEFSKTSPNTTAYKFLASGDATLFNLGSGDISILNDFASGKIKFGAGGSFTNQMVLNTDGVFEVFNTSKFGTSTFTNKLNAQFGTFGIQSYAVNNGFMSDNMFYNGTTWTRIATGFGYGFQFINGQVSFHGVATGTGAFTQNIKFKFDYEGAFIVGNNLSATQGDYTGATALFTKNGRLLLGTTTENTSALLNVNSTTQGFLPPRMTTTQKNAIGTPAAGLMVFDTTLAKLCVYSGSAWETITSI